MFGAVPDPDDTGRHWGHFNGKIARPVLLAAALDEAQVVRLAAGAPPGDFGPVAGWWDLSRDVSGRTVRDVSGHGNDGLTYNAPARAVTGPMWDGISSRVATDRPEHCDAIHFHDDDLDDARWEPCAEIEVPGSVTSGIYAVRLEVETDAVEVPFVVRRGQAVRRGPAPGTHADLAGIRQQPGLLRLHRRRRARSSAVPLRAAP